MIENNIAIPPEVHWRLACLRQEIPVAVSVPSHFTFADATSLICLLFFAIIIVFIWCCILSSDELTDEQILYMEEQGKQQMRDAGWSEDDIERIG